MTALLHRHQPPAPIPACGSDAYYWVSTDAAIRLSCGPHLHMMLGQLYTERPVIAAEEPPPGSRCEYIPEVAR